MQGGSQARQSNYRQSMKRPDYRNLQFTCATLWGLFFTTAIFTSFPKIDLWVARLFAAPDGSFPLAANPALGLLRNFYKLLFILLFSVSVTMLLFNLRVRRDTKIPTKIWGFVCAVFLLGPGLLVNVILKDNWGRARPSQIEEFGGAAQFTPPLLFADECKRNCSFVSGEGATIASVMIVLVTLLWHAFPDRRRLLVAGAVAVGISGAFLRVIKGRHFLSDTLFAALFSALVILVLYGLFNIRKHRRAISLPALRHDFGAVWIELADAIRRVKHRLM